MVLFRFLPVLFLLGGCVDASEPPTAAPSAAASFLENVDVAVFRAAYAPGGALGMTRSTRTVELTTRGDTRAAFERTVRFASGAPTLLSADTTGTFSTNVLARWSPSVEFEQRNLAADVLPEDAAFLSARNRDAYTATLHPDTMLLGRQTQVVSVEAVPGEGDDQAVRRARLYVDVESGALVALHLARATETLLFDESGTTFLQIRRLTDGRWVPHRTRVDHKVKTLFRPLRHFRTEHAYTDSRED